MKRHSIFQSFRFAFSGLRSMFRERNFQIEFAALLINLALIFLLELSPQDSAMILLICAAVLSAEIFNTAVEKICDFIQPSQDARIKFIKDISAGAVLLLAFAAIAAAILIYPKYLSLLFS